MQGPLRKLPAPGKTRPEEAGPAASAKRGLPGGDAGRGHTQVAQDSAPASRWVRPAYDRLSSVCSTRTPGRQCRPVGACGHEAGFISKWGDVLAGPWGSSGSTAGPAGRARVHTWGAQGAGRRTEGRH